MIPKNDAEAPEKDFKDAHKKFEDFLEEYISARPIIRGRENYPRKPVTIEVMDEMDRLEKDMEKKFNLWMKFLRSQPR